MGEGVEEEESSGVHTILEVPGPPEGLGEFWAPEVG